MKNRPLRFAALPFVLVGTVGCDLDVERTGGPVMNEAQQAADALDSPPPAPTPAPAPADPAPPADGTAPPADPNAASPMPMPAGEESGTHVGRDTKEVLDAQALANDPNWSVAAEDPSKLGAFSATGTAYNRAAALAGSVNLGQWIKLEQAQSGEWPTYEQLKDYVANNPVDMPALREYQHYGYDASTGKIVILENQPEKAKRRGELGLPVNE